MRLMVIANHWVPSIKTKLLRQKNKTRLDGKLSVVSNNMLILSECVHLIKAFISLIYYIIFIMKYNGELNGEKCFFF